MGWVLPPPFFFKADTSYFYEVKFIDLSFIAFGLCDILRKAFPDSMTGKKKSTLAAMAQ